MKKKVLFGLLPLLLTTLAGCGGGEDTSSSTPTDSTSSTSVTPTSTTTTSTSTVPVGNKYTVTWNNWDGSLLEKDENVLEGSTPSYDGAAPTRPDDTMYRYTFAGWDPALTPVTSNQIYTATYNQSKLTYTIDFDLQGGTSASYDGPKTVEAFSSELFFFDVTKEGWNFRGWSYNNEKIFDEKGHQLANPVMAKNMTFTAIFSQTVKLEITKNIAAAATIIGEGEYPYNTDVGIVAEVNDGYKFLGWYVGEVLVATSQSYNFKMWSEDVTIEARFVQVSHVLKVKSNNVMNGTVKIQTAMSPGYAEQDIQYIDFGNQVTIVANTIKEVRFLGWFDEDGELIDTNAIYNFVMPNEDVTLIAKWNEFKIEYDLNGGVNNEDNPEDYCLEDEEVVILAPSPSLVGYVFDSWIIDDGKTTISWPYSTFVFEASAMENIKLTASWKIVSYSLTVRSSSGAKGTVEMISGIGDEGCPVEVQATAKDGCVFKGWVDNNKNLLSKNAYYEFDMPAGTYTIEAQFMTLEELGMKPFKTTNSITYGYYPKSRVVQQDLINNLETKAVAEYFVFYYYNCAYYYREGTDSWYKFEPVKWKLLDSSSRTYISEQIIDAHSYNASIVLKPCRYSTSSAYTYLTTEIEDYMFHFNKTYLSPVEVDNDRRTTDSDTNPNCPVFGDSDYRMVNQYLYLPSYQEMVDPDYRFSSNPKASKTRQADLSDYAYDKYDEGFAISNYWTRSPVSTGEAKKVWFVDANGKLTERITDELIGMRPMVRFSDAVDAL